VEMRAWGGAGVGDFSTDGYYQCRDEPVTKGLLSTPHRCSNYQNENCVENHSVAKYLHTAIG
jgi:hypothetical protein